jgi:hypothetical protein
MIEPALSLTAPHSPSLREGGLLYPDISSQIVNHLRSKHEEYREIAGGARWRCSKLGYCLKGQWLAAKGVKPTREVDDLSLRRFEVGHFWGRSFTQWFTDMGWDFQEEEIFFDGSLNLGGHADYVISKPFELGIELKSVQSRAFWYAAKGQGPVAKPHHLIQAGAYDLMMRRQGSAIPWIVLCASKDDLTLEQTPVREEHREMALSRAEALNYYFDENIAPPCECIGWMKKFCDYRTSGERCCEEVSGEAR